MEQDGKAKGNAACTGEKTVYDHLTVLRLHGGWREMGRQYGTLLREEIQTVFQKASLRATSRSDHFLLPDGLPMGIGFLDELFSGVAEGSGLSLQQLIRLNGVEVAYMDELLTLFGQGAAGQCSALGLFGSKARDGILVYGRNYDWLPSFDSLPQVLVIFEPDDGTPAIATLNLAGCLYMTTGMNGAGVFLELNSGCYASAECKPSLLHNGWHLWNVLQQAQSADQAAELLKTIPGAYHVIIGIADAARCLAFEWAVDSAVTVTASEDCGILAMSNHFVQPGWNNLPGATAGGAISSVSRRNGLLKLAEAVPCGTGDVPALQAIMDVNAEQGGARWAGTLFQVVAVPQEKRMLIRTKRADSWTEVRLG